MHLNAFKNIKKAVLPIVKLMCSLYNVFCTSLICNELADFSSHEPTWGHKHSIKYNSIA